MLRRFLAAAALTMFASPPLAAQTLTVEGVISPAWVERGGKREPLTVGMGLKDKDRIHTGAGSRALIRMAEGSAVKVGENAVLAVDRLLEKKSADAGFVAASLDVVRGAFRFTTGVFGAGSARRDVRIRISAVTAGIRGTDVWGKSEAERDIVCLLEGRISVEHAGQSFAMEEPLSFFIAPRKGKPRPVAPVSKQQVDEWSEETETREGRGAIRRGGRHRVEFDATGDHNAAMQLRNRLRTAGFPAEIETARDNYGGEEYRAAIGNLSGAKDAQALAQKLRTLGFAGAATR